MTGAGGSEARCGGSGGIVICFERLALDGMLSCLVDVGAGEAAAGVGTLGGLADGFGFTAEGTPANMNRRTHIIVIQSAASDFNMMDAA